jgi:hypothetical protein
MERLEAERQATPFLLYRDDAGRQRLVDLDAMPRRLTIGRRPDCDIAVPWDGEASRLHAELEEIVGEWTVVDDGRSRNGTFLNGNRVLGRKRLSDGDAIAVGRTLIVFRHPAFSSAWATTTGSSGEPPDVSPAQKRVLVALCRPLADASDFASPASNRQIAAELFVSQDTVKGHLRALFELFGIGDVPQNEKRAALAHAAMQHGLVTLHNLKSTPVPVGRHPASGA